MYSGVPVSPIIMLYSWPIQVSGGLVLASLLQVFMGSTGIIGFLMNYIGPITLAPSVMVIGLSLYPVAIESSHHQWGVALL